MHSPRFKRGILVSEAEREWAWVHAAQNPLAGKMTTSRWARLVLVLFSLFPLVDLSAKTPQKPDLSELTLQERQSIESVCSHAKYSVGPAAYDECVQRQLSSLDGSRRPDLSKLTLQERQSIESVCSREKYSVGPAAYDECVQRQLSSLDGSRRPDLSKLTLGERQSIESVCSHEKYSVGPAAYDDCVRKQLNELGKVTEAEHPKAATLESTAQHLNLPNTPQASTPSPERKRLGYFIGTWTLEGVINTSPFGPGGKFTGTHYNEWTPDGLSLAIRWDEQRPSGSDKGRGVYSYDSIQKVYKYHGTGSDGETEDSTGKLEGNTWTWISSPMLANGDAVKGRFTMKENSPSSYSFKFEMAPESGEWKTVMEGKAEKSK